MSRRSIRESLPGRGSRGNEGKRVLGGRLKRGYLDRRVGQRKWGLGASVSTSGRLMILDETCCRILQKPGPVSGNLRGKRSPMTIIIRVLTAFRTTLTFLHIVTPVLVL